MKTAITIAAVILAACASAAPLRMATEAYATSAAQEAASAAQERAVADAADYTDRATNGLLRAESDPTVPAWAKAASAPLPPNYTTVSNKAMTALQSYTETDPTVPSWAKEPNKPTYGTNDIDGLSAALNGKLDKTGGTMTGSVQFNAGWTAMGDMSDTISVGEDAGDGYVRIGETKYRRTGILTHNAILYFPADSGTIALKSDIPNISGKADKADVAAAATDATNYTDTSISAAIAPANPTFSNAVLSVGLGIDTNTVAAINALVEAGDELPIGGAATVGGLLLALAAAVAALKRTKADASALRYPFAATIQPTAGTAAPTGTLTDRAGNKVVCTEATGQTGNNAKLTLTLPPAVPGYVRDFLVKIDRTTSGCYSVDFVPYGNESVSYETEDGSMPEVPDGKVTWLSFTESESGGVFAVRAMPLVAVTGGS